MLVLLDFSISLRIKIAGRYKNARANLALGLVKCQK